MKKTPGSGRKSLLTPELRTRLLQLLRMCNSRKDAAREVGVDERTLKKWIAWGKEGKEPHKTFVADVEKAEAQAMVRNVNMIATHPDWRARAWLMAKKDPAQFGDQVRITIEDGLQHMLTVAERALEATQFARLLEALASETGQEAPALPRAGGAPEEPIH